VLQSNRELQLVRVAKINKARVNYFYTST